MKKQQKVTAYHHVSQFIMKDHPKPTEAQKEVVKWRMKNMTGEGRNI